VVLYMLGSHKISIGLGHPGLHHVYLSSHVRGTWLGVDERRASGAHGGRSLIGERLTAAWIVALELTTVWRRPELLLGGEGRRLLLIETASAAAALVASTVIVGTGWGNARTARITVDGLRRVAPHVVLLRSELNGQRSRHTL
jgi:hypothetical protein